MKVKGLILTILLAAAVGVSAQNRVPPTQTAPPGETGRRVTEDGLLANYFPANSKGPGILWLSGSVGGLLPEGNRASVALQAQGYSTLHLSYFRGEGQNPRLEMMPLEYFNTALEWLRRQPEVDPERVAVIGTSKGAEAALLIAVRHPELKAVIAALPSSVVWPGIVWQESAGRIGSSWSEGREPLPHMPHAPYDASRGGTMADNYAASLKAYAQHPDAIIPVEKMRAALMLVCAQADQVWPSCPMAHQIDDRLRTKGRPAPILLEYKGSGHGAFGLPMPDNTDPRLTAGGGNAADTNAARADSWSKAVNFLKTNLAK